MNKQKQNLALYSLLMAVLVMCSLYYFGVPMLAQLKNTNKNIAIKQKENNQLQEKINNILNIKKEIDSDNELAKLLNIAMPDGVSASTLIETVGSVASNYSLELNGIRQVKSDNSNKVTLEVGLTGSYKSVKMFIEDLENNVRIGRVAKISIQKGQENNDSSSVKSTLSIDFIKLGSNMEKGGDNE